MGSIGIPEPPSTKPLSADGEHALVREFRVEVLEGVDRGVRFRSTRERALIGTHASADLVLRDPAISRFHLELALDGGRVLLRDLDSRNGTAVDGVAVQAAYLSGAH